VLVNGGHGASLGYHNQRPAAARASGDRQRGVFLMVRSEDGVHRFVGESQSLHIASPGVGAILGLAVSNLAARAAAYRHQGGLWVVCVRSRGHIHARFLMMEDDTDRLACHVWSTLLPSAKGRSCAHGNARSGASLLKHY
jgi:hypothetical protein